MNKNQLAMLALHAVDLAKKGEDVALKLTDKEAEYFLNLLDKIDITWASGKKPSVFKYYMYGRDKILWIMEGKAFFKHGIGLSYVDLEDFPFGVPLLRPSDMKEPDNFRRYQ